MKRLLICPVLFLITVSCEKEFETRDFSGIICTDDYGNMVKVYGVEDGDWKFDDNFSSKELKLFSPDFSTASNCVSLNEGGMINAAGPKVIGFPNPTGVNNGSKFYISFQNKQSSNCKFKIIIVDSKYNSLLNFEKRITWSNLFVTINLAEIAGVHLDKIHRIYYMIEIDNSNILYGHGDFILTTDTLQWFREHN